MQLFDKSTIVSVMVLLLLSALISILIIILIFKQKIRRIIIKDAHKLDQEGKIVEKMIEKEFRKI